MTDIVDEASPAPQGADIKTTPPGPDFRQAASYTLMWFLTMLVTSLPLYVICRLIGLHNLLNTCSTLAYPIASALILRHVIRTSGGTWRAYFPLRRVPVRLLVLVSVAGFVIIFGTVELLRHLPFYDVIKTRITPDMFRPAALVLIVRGLIAPVFEELFFRGWMLFGFLNRYSPRNAILLSSGIFAVGHFNPVMIAYAFPAGLLFAWMARRTGSLLPGIVAHMVVNTAASILGIVAYR